MNKKLRKLIANLLAELLDGESKMSTRNKLLLLNAALLATLIALLSCTYSGSITSDLNYRLPNQQPQQQQQHQQQQQRQDHPQETTAILALRAQPFTPSDRSFRPSSNRV